MKWKRVGSFLVIAIIAQSYCAAILRAEPMRIRNDGPMQEILVAVAPPPREGLTLVSILPMTVEGKVLGGLAAYDDAATSRPTDYLELFNDVGALLAVGWFDRFGIERLAVDRALLEEADNLAGVFVLVLMGDPI
jgi:hypothetical protein